MSDRLLAALKRKFKTPAEAMAKLGLDSKLLTNPATPKSNGGNRERTTMLKSAVSPTAILATGALRTYLAPRLAADAQIHVTPLLKGVTRKNFTSKIPDIVAALQRETRGRLAQDADIQDVAEMLEAIARVGDDEPEMDGMEDPDMAPATMGGGGEGGGDAEGEDPAAVVARIKEMLKDKLPPEELARLDEAVGASMHAGAEGGATDEEEEEMGEDEEEEGVMGGAADEPPPFKGRPNPGGTMDKKAMDAAITKRIADAKGEWRREQRAIEEAREYVRPWVGGLPGLAADSALDVYKAACRGLKLEEAQHIDDPRALRAMIGLIKKPGERELALAQDAAPPAARTGFAGRFPSAARIVSM